LINLCNNILAAILFWIFWEQITFFLVSLSQRINCETSAHCIVGCSDLSGSILCILNRI